jgi:hypothetical protein
LKEATRMTDTNRRVEIAYRTDRIAPLKRKTFADEAAADRWIEANDPAEVRWATSPPA